MWCNLRSLLYSADLPTSIESTTVISAYDIAVLAMDSDPGIASQKLQTKPGTIQKWLKGWRIKAIFGLKRVVVMGGLRKLRNKELPDLYSTSSIIKIIKLRRKRWAGHVTRMGE
jgi:hypothetical protein